MASEKIVISRTPDTVKINFNEIPAHAKDALARALISDIKEAFKNPEVSADYKRWKKERAKRLK
jgi:hypothetical protein